MCDCLKEVQQKVIDFTKEKFKEEGKAISRYGDAKITTTLFTFSSQSLGNSLYFPFEMEYWPLLKDGFEGKKKIFKTTITFTHCPFCGEAYLKEANWKQIEEGNEETE